MVSLRSLDLHSEDSDGLRPPQLADNLIQTNRWHTRNGLLYLWDAAANIWLEGEEKVHAMVSELLGKRATSHFAKEVIWNLKAKTSAAAASFTASRSGDIPDLPLELIPVQNGLLNWQTLELKPYSPDYFFTFKIPVKYDPTATCPLIDNFLGEVARPEDQPTLREELPGYCLFRSYTIQKAFMLVGDGANGKSTYLLLIRVFVGPGNVGNRSLQDLNSNRFAAADLYMKHVNIFADLRDLAISSTGTFKMLVGGDAISAERKFRDPFTFINRAKLIFSANKWPKADDESLAYLRRWCIIDFPNTFIGPKADPKILEKLTTPEELSGLLNHALRGLKRLLEKSEFTTSRSIEETQELIAKLSDPVVAFLDDKTIEDPEAETPKDDLYNAYVTYCHEKKLPAQNKNVLTTAIYRIRGNAVTTTRPRGKGKNRPWCYKGIRLRKPGDEKEEESENQSKDGPTGPAGLADSHILGELEDNTLESFRVRETDGPSGPARPDRDSATCGDCNRFRTEDCPQPRPQELPKGAKWPGGCDAFSLTDGG